MTRSSQERDLGDRLATPARAALYCLLVGCAALWSWNALEHPAWVAYDGRAHLLYVETLAHGRLPDPIDTHEYFGPPLPYLLAAALRASGWFELAVAARVAQISQVGLGLLAAFGVLRLSRIAIGAAPRFGWFALVLLVGLPVWPKTLVQIRGEVWLAPLLLLLLIEIAQVLRGDHGGRVPWVRLALLGGLLGLARQWGLVSVSAATLHLLVRASRASGLDRKRLLSLAIAPLAGALVLSSWFYLDLVSGRGVELFPRRGHPPTLSNQPREFYLGTGNGVLFSDPVRPAFPNQALPILFTEVWGDYWAYFQVWGFDEERRRVLFGQDLERAWRDPQAKLRSNSEEARPALARANLLGVAGSTWLLLALGWSTAGLLRQMVLPYTSSAIGEEMRALCVSVCLAGLAAFALFTIAFPELQRGDTLKASYLLHLFPLLALLGAALLERVRRATPRTAWLVAFALALSLAANLPRHFTSYSTVAALGESRFRSIEELAAKRHQQFLRRASRTERGPS